ncbi:MAG: aspartate carbamoyltransferase [Candidatus Kerfeldbacteria bacterium CG_4_9_14_3_um_filter_45_8]|nr:MAG: aspartate carbamoyltransferase [Candidatus Kerfeldbacteria bacterium CG_4_9_14_3_um_filter_45_8]
MLQGKNLISIDDLTRDDIDSVLELARYFETDGYLRHRLDGVIMGSLFFESSTRTRLSFDSAMQRVGGRVIGFSDSSATSYGKKGESFSDTIKMIDGYSDVIVIRHPDHGAASKAAAVAEHPVINAGDGANEHPTQTLIDLHAIQSSQGKIDGLTIALVGDLKYGRVPHSLAKALSLYPATRQIWIAPDSLRMPEDIRQRIISAGVDVKETSDLSVALAEADVIYMTRVQAERFEDQAEYDQVKDIYVLQPELLTTVKPNLRILHALPRRYEIPESIDKTKYAYYFEQAKGGVPVRASLLTHILGQVKP